MEKYYALIEGNNFLVDLDGEKTRVGFYTTIYFERNYQYKDDVLNYISDQLITRIKNSEALFLSSPFSFFYVKELSTIEDESDNEDLVKDGFSFFRMSKFQATMSVFMCYIKYALLKLKFIDSLKRPILLGNSTYLRAE